MTIPVWPASLPQVLDTEGYGEQAADVALRTEMDAGPAKVRRRFTAGVRSIAGRVVCDKTQVETFMTFFRNTLLGGTLRFQWAEPRDPLTTAEFRFTEPPSLSALGGGWYQVSMSLEIMP